MPGKHVAQQIIGMKFGVILGFVSGKIDILKWEAIDSAEYKVCFIPLIFLNFQDFQKM
jgi:Na+/H+-dicarboxylate symporter